MKEGGLVARLLAPTRTLRGWTGLWRNLVADRRVPVRWRCPVGQEAWVSGCVRRAPICVEGLCPLCGQVSRIAVYPQVTGAPPSDCKSVAKAPKARILHLPRAARRGR